MIIQLRDMRDLRTHQLSYYDNLTEAETQAVQIMDTMGFRWERGEFDSNCFEYCKSPAIGTARVYVRIKTLDTYPQCKCGATAIYETRQARFCKACYEDTYSE